MAKSRKRAAWFIAAWALVMCALVCLSMIFDTPSSGLSSWRFFSLYAVIFTFGPLVWACLCKGFDQ